MLFCCNWCNKFSKVKTFFSQKIRIQVHNISINCYNILMLTRMCIFLLILFLFYFLIIHCVMCVLKHKFGKFRRDNANTRIPRSSSIDSMVEAVWSETSTPRPSLTLSPPPQTSQPTPQYLQINYGNTGSISRRESLLSPSAGRRAKQQRYIAGKCTPF